MISESKRESEKAEIYKNIHIEDLFPEIAEAI